MTDLVTFYVVDDDCTVEVRIGRYGNNGNPSYGDARWRCPLNDLFSTHDAYTSTNPELPFPLVKLDSFDVVYNSARAYLAPFLAHLNRDTSDSGKYGFNQAGPGPSIRRRFLLQ